MGEGLRQSGVIDAYSNFGFDDYSPLIRISSNSVPEGP